MKRSGFTTQMSSVALVALAAFATVSCRDDADALSASADSNSKSQEELMRERRKEMTDSINLSFALYQLCRMDGGAYKLRMGEVLNPATPSVYSIAVDNADAALRQFKNLLPGDVCESMEKTGKWDYSTKFGSLRYAAGDGADKLGTIYIDIPKIPGYKRIEIIPKNLWRSNAEDCVTPYRFSNIYRENTTGHYYLCVREATGRIPGIMVSFDPEACGNPSEVTGEKGKTLYFKNMATKAAAFALIDFLKFQPKRSDDMYRELKSLMKKQFENRRDSLNRIGKIEEANVTNAAMEELATMVTREHDLTKGRDYRVDLENPDWWKFWGPKRLHYHKYKFEGNEEQNCSVYAALDRHKIDMRTSGNNMHSEEFGYSDTRFSLAADDATETEEQEQDGAANPKP